MTSLLNDVVDAFAYEAMRRNPYTDPPAPRDMARVATKVVFARLREPTPRMLAALTREKKLFGAKLTIAQAWQAMVDAAEEEAGA